MNQLKQIPLFFTFDRHYVVPAAVAFYSLLRHASALYFYKLYVLHTSISPRQQQKLTRLVERFPNADLTFIDVSRFDTQPDILQGKSHFSKEIYYKLLAADLFPQYDRILCSDVDVVFTGDIAPSYFLFPDDDFYYAGVGQILESGRMQTYEGRFNETENRGYDRKSWRVTCCSTSRPCVPTVCSNASPTSTSKTTTACPCPNRIASSCVAGRE